MRERDRGPSLQRLRPKTQRAARIEGLLILSGEDLLYERTEELLRGIHLPLFEAHFGPVWPREALEDSWRSSSFDRGGGSRGRLVRLASMLSLLSLGCEEGDRRADFARFSRALWSWLSLAGSPSTGSLARFIAARGALSKDLAPALSFSVDLDARLRALRPPALRPALAELQRVLPASLGLAALTGLPGSVVAASAAGPRFWRIWDDSLRCPLSALAADLGVHRALGDEEGGSRPRFAGGRLLLLGSRRGDRRLAKALGADFVEVLPGLEAEALEGLARGFASLKARVSEA